MKYADKQISLIRIYCCAVDVRMKACPVEEIEIILVLCSRVHHNKVVAWKLKNNNTVNIY